MKQTINPKNCPKYLPADNPARINRDQSIIMQAAKGLPQRDIAKNVGINQSQVSVILSDDDAKAKLQAIINKHIEASTDIQDNLISIAKTAPGDNDSIRTTDIIAATKEHNQIIGIAGSHTQSNVFINKFYQQNNANVISPAVLDMLKQHNADVIDIDIPEA